MSRRLAIFVGVLMVLASAAVAIARTSDPPAPQPVVSATPTRAPSAPAPETTPAPSSPALSSLAPVVAESKTERHDIHGSRNLGAVSGDVMEGKSVSGRHVDRVTPSPATPTPTGASTASDPSS